MPLRKDVNEVGMSVTPLEIEGGIDNQTKSSFIFDGSGQFEFQWNVTDTVGIFPNAGSQAYFCMSSFAGSSNALFEGGGWALKGDGAHSYAAYAPYKFENQNLGKVPFNYRGQSYNGSNPYDNVAKYQYLGCALQTPSNGALNYVFERLECFVWFQFTLPNGYAKEFESLTFKLKDGSPIAVGTEVNFTGATTEINPVIYQNSFTLPMSNVQTTVVNNVINVYMMLPPQDFTGKKIMVAVRTTDGDTCRGEIEGKNCRKNKGRQYTATLTSDFGSLVEGFDGKPGQWN